MFFSLSSTKMNVTTFPACQGCGMPTGDAYSSGHLVPSLWDLHMFYLLRPILFRTCRYFTGLCSSNIPRYFLDFAHKTSLWEALHQINLILWFFGFKTCKDNSYVNKLKLFITENPVYRLLRFSIKPVTVGWFWLQRQYFCTQHEVYLN